jgi:hypothetical protein
MVLGDLLKSPASLAGGPLYGVPDDLRQLGRRFKDQTGKCLDFPRQFNHRPTACHPDSGDPMLGTDSTIHLTDMDLIGLAAARLKLRQAAWGPEGESMSLATVQTLAAGLPAGVAVDLSAVDDDAVFPAHSGRILANLLLLAADSLPGGGTIVLAGRAEDLFVQISGPGASWPLELPLCFANRTDAQTALGNAATWQMALTALFANAASIRLSVLLSSTTQAQPAILRLDG